MKKVLSVILAAVLLFGSSIFVLAVPTLSGMTQTMSFSNWYGIGLLQTYSNDIVSSYSQSNPTYTNFATGKQIMFTGSGSSNQMLAGFAYNGYSIIPEYCSGQSFNASFTVQTGGVYNTANDPVYMLVCDEDYLTYFFQNVATKAAMIPWLQSLTEVKISGQLNHDKVLGNWFAWKKIDNWASGSTNQVSIDFTIPEGTNNLYVCIVCGRTQPGNIILTLSDITISPTGQTYELWQGILADQRDQKFQEDVIGSDAGDDDEGSGLLGIIKFIKNLPQWIADKFIGLFVPEDGYLENAFDQLSDTLGEHFGIIWQAGDIIVQIITKISQFSPGTSSDPMDYDLKFPAAEVQIDVQDDGSVDFNSGEGSLFPLIPDQGDGYYHVDLSFFADGTGATIYSLYRAFVTVILILGFIWLSHRKFKELFAGGGDA